MEIIYKPIGTIHSPFKTVEGVPIQPSGAESIRGTIEIFLEYKEGLQDLEGFSHIILIYHFHRAQEPKLTVTPFMDSTPHGVFSTRAATRPNPVGFSVVRLLHIEGCALIIENVDILDGTPLLDLKPYVPEFDHYAVNRTGWLAKASGVVKRKKSDKWFG